MRPTVLVVDDEAAFRTLVVDILASEGYHLLEADSAEEGLALLAEHKVDLLLTDQRMPGLDGLELARRARRSAHAPAVVMMTAYGTIPQAVEAMQAGVADYLTKPLESPAALRRLVRRVLGEHRQAEDDEGEFLSRDPMVLELLALLDKAASTTASILITGESGTGKELLARRVHHNSPRRNGPFVPVNCAAIPEQLAESELFGHEKGAFTGADRRRQGRFEQAHGGTLFLDEVGELGEPVQAKLLRALEERAIQRVGGTTAIPLDLRVVAATNRSLEDRVQEGTFRADLFYRLNVVAVKVPPLRQRPADIALLAPILSRTIAHRFGVETGELTPEALDLLQAHPWPGNVRELRNVLERALIAAGGGAITPATLPELVPASPAPRAPGAHEDRPPLALEERERQAILDALQQCEGHRARAAELLGISVRTLYNRLKQYGIR